jgi:hypothetical protein
MTCFDARKAPSVFIRRDVSKSSALTSFDAPPYARA